MARTLQQLVSDVIREVRGQTSPLEAQQALRDALDVIDSKGNWEFLITRTIINIVQPYSTGTVAIALTSGTNVLGTGSAWKALEGAAVVSYKTIKLASRLMPYEVSIINDDTHLNLTTSLGGTADITADTYSMYQMRYKLPADC